MKIVLLGYMGCGKSTIGKYLAKKLYLPFIDLDDYIEEKEKLPIKAIFKTKGEIYFRKIEHTYLKDILEQKKKFVLSLGGGTPCYANNIDLIANCTIPFYLQANIKTLKERLISRKKRRPLIANLSDKNISEFIAKHIFERKPYYEKAPHKIIVDKKSISQIATEIRILLH